MRSFTLLLLSITLLASTALSATATCDQLSKGLSEKLAIAFEGYSSGSDVLNLSESIRLNGYKTRLAGLKEVEQDRPECFERVANDVTLSQFNRIDLTGSSRENRRAAQLLQQLRVAGHLQPVSYSSRARLSGVWALKGRDQRHRLLGSYDCSTITIFYDPYLPDLDVAGTLLHELGHFLRDRAIPHTTHVNVRDLILLDEFASVVQTGFQQASNSFELGFDGNLFERNGPLQTYISRWRQVNPHNITKRHGAAIVDAVKNPSDQNFVQTILKRTAVGYFQNPELVFTETASLLQGHQVSAEYLDPWLTPATNISLQGMSKTCRQVQEAQERGELQDYLGTHVATPAGNQTRKRSPRPGNDGVRPGNDGVRPSVPVMPCLNLAP